MDAKGTSKNFQRLEGPGRLTIEEGRFTRLPLLDPIAQVLEIPELSDLRTSEAFVDFKLRDEKAFVESLVLATPSLRLGAKGVSRFDNKLNLDATLTIADPIAKRIPDFSLQNFHKVNEQYALEFKITGSNDHPKTDLAEKLIGGSVKEKVEDLLSGLFGTKAKPKEKEKDKGKEKDPEKKKDKSKTETKPEKTDTKPESSEAPTRL